MYMCTVTALKKKKKYTQNFFLNEFVNVFLCTCVCPYVYMHRAQLWISVCMWDCVSQALAPQSVSWGSAALASPGNWWQCRHSGALQTHWIRVHIFNQPPGGSSSRSTTINHPGCARPDCRVRSKLEILKSCQKDRRFSYWHYTGIIISRLCSSHTCRQRPNLPFKKGENTCHHKHTTHTWAFVDTFSSGLALKSPSARMWSFFLNMQRNLLLFIQ